MFIHLLASLFSFTILVNALPIGSAEPLSTSNVPELIIQHSPPSPLLDDLQPSAPQGVMLSRDGLFFSIYSNNNRNEIGDEELLSTVERHLAFDFSLSSISPYPSFVDTLSNALYTLASTTYDKLKTLYNLRANQGHPPLIRGTAKVSESLDASSSEDGYKASGVYPIIDKTQLSKKERKKETRMREGWVGFEKIISAFGSSSFSPPESAPDNLPKDFAGERSPFHRGIKDATRQA